MNKKKKILLIIISIIIILLVSLIIFFSFNKKNNKTSNNNIVNKNDSNVDKNESSNEKVEDKKDSRLDDILEFKSVELENKSSRVTTANYKYDNKYKEFKRNVQDTEKEEVRNINDSGFNIKYNYGKEYLKDLKVPYINIDSRDAKEINKKLEDKYKLFAGRFDEYAENEKSGKAKDNLTLSASQILTYGTFEYKDILSVVIVSGVQSTSNWILDFDTYLFDINSGKHLSFNEVLDKTLYTKEGVLEKVNNIIPGRMNGVYGKESGSWCGEESCYDLTYNKIKEEIDNNKISYFVDNDGNLNLITYIYNTGVQGGTDKKYIYKIEK